MKLPPLNLLIGVALAGAVFVAAAMGLVWTTYDPLAMDFTERSKARMGSARWLNVW